MLSQLYSSVLGQSKQVIQFNLILFHDIIVKSELCHIDYNKIKTDNVDAIQISIASSL